MIKVNIKSDVLKETRNKMDVVLDVMVDVDGPANILEEELYNLLKEFESKIPNIWINALERVMLDRLEDCCDSEGEDEE